MDKIKVDIISDIVCPWCIIGYKRLEQAIIELRIQDEIEVEWHPFELNPDMSPAGEELPSYFLRKYGMSPEEGIRTRAHIAALGAELDFTFTFFDGMKKYNTQDAHILIDYAKGFGKQTELTLRLFSAYFSERKDISDRDTLADELQKVGLDASQAIAQLDDEGTRKRVQSKAIQWRSQGVSSVPTMIFNHATAVTGAQPIEAYKLTLAELAP